MASIIQLVCGFYRPLITKTMERLKPNGVFVLNIGDRKYPLSKILIEYCAGSYRVKKLRDYIGGKAGLGRITQGELFYEISNI